MIAALIPFITGALGTVIDRVIPDTAARDAAKLDLEGELLKLAGKSNLAQIELNAAEAIALIYQFVVAPLAVWGAAVFGHPIPAPPTLDGMLWELLFGMMGMAGLRTFEKSRGLTN